MKIRRDRKARVKIYLLLGVFKVINGRIEMKTKLLEYLEAFSDYYQATVLRRLVVGFFIGGILWIGIVIFAIVMGIFVEDNLFLKTVQLDLPGIGGIIALLVSFQIWGLLPQPLANEEEQLSTDNKIEKGETSEDLISTEAIKTENEQE